METEEKQRDAYPQQRCLLLSLLHNFSQLKQQISILFLTFFHINTFHASLKIESKVFFVFPYWQKNGREDKYISMINF